MKDRVNIIRLFNPVFFNVSFACIVYYDEADKFFLVTYKADVLLMKKEFPSLEAAKEGFWEAYKDKAYMSENGIFWLPPQVL
ncbi:MAG: hypothetical protein KAW12_12225 [Candidatus Aminicenantes bacterium]|nr:hypothetical protein [Candidatus Aminicenantes bacterium]